MQVRKTHGSVNENLNRLLFNKNKNNICSFNENEGSERRYDEWDVKINPKTSYNLEVVENNCTIENTFISKEKSKKNSNNFQTKSLKLNYVSKRKHYLTMNDNNEIKSTLNKKRDELLRYIPCTNCGRMIDVELTEQHSESCFRNQSKGNQLTKLNTKLLKLKESLSSINSSPTPNLTHKEIADMKYISKILSEYITKVLQINTIDKRSLKELKQTLKSIENFNCTYHGNLSNKFLVERTKNLCVEKYTFLKQGFERGKNGEKSSGKMKKFAAGENVGNKTKEIKRLEKEKLTMEKAMKDIREMKEMLKKFVESNNGSDIDVRLSGRNNSRNVRVRANFNIISSNYICTFNKQRLNIKTNSAVSRQKNNTSASGVYSSDTNFNHNNDIDSNVNYHNNNKGNNIKSQTSNKVQTENSTENNQKNKITSEVIENTIQNEKDTKYNSITLRTDNDKYLNDLNQRFFNEESKSADSESDRSNNATVKYSAYSLNPNTKIKLENNNKEEECDDFSFRTNNNRAKTYKKFSELTNTLNSEESDNNFSISNTSIENSGSGTNNTKEKKNKTKAKFYMLVMKTKFEKLHSSHKGMKIKSKDLWKEALSNKIPQEKWSYFILQELNKPSKYLKDTSTLGNNSPFRTPMPIIKEEINNTNQ